MAYKKYDYSAGAGAGTILTTIDDMLCGTNNSGNNAGLVDMGWEQYDVSTGTTNKNAYWSNPRKTISGSAIPTTQLSPSGSGTGGSFGVGTYCVTYSWVYADGETKCRVQSPEESVTFASGTTNSINITIPTIPTNVQRCNIYVGNVSGGERYQTYFSSAGAQVLTGTGYAYTNNLKKPYYGVEDGGNVVSDNVFITIEVTATGYISLRVGERWNDGSNSMTNPTYGSFTLYDQTWDASNGGSLYISGSKEYLMFLSYNVTNGWGPASSSEMHSGVYTCTRHYAEDTYLFGVPSYAAHDVSSNTLYAPRLKNGTSANANLSILTPVSGSGYGYAGLSNWTGKHAVFELFAANVTQTYNDFKGKVNGLKSTTTSWGGTGDVVQISGQNYLVINASTFRFLMPQF